MRYTDIYRDNKKRRAGRSAKTRRNNRLRKSMIRTGMIIAVFAGILAAILILSGSAVRTDASVASGTKYYKSVIIRNGDTLWSIAQEYMEPSEYYDTREYVNEIMQINSLENDRINSGCYLIIPVYSYE